MRIVRVGPPSGRRGYRRVEVDNGAAFRLPPSDISALRLEEGADIDPAVLTQVRVRAERMLAVEIAHRLLAIRPRSRHELMARLQRRGVSADVLNAVIADLERQGLVDDSRFADAWIRTRVALQPSGQIRLRHELAHKGVAREVIDRTLSETLNEQQEAALAQEVARMRLRRYRGLPPGVTYRRLAGVLQRRGFSSSVIARTLHAVLGVRTATD